MNCAISVRDICFPDYLQEHRSNTIAIPLDLYGNLYEYRRAILDEAEGDSVFGDEWTNEHWCAFGREIERIDDVDLDHVDQHYAAYVSACGGKLREDEERPTIWIDVDFHNDS